MTRLEYILERLHDAQLRNDMAKVVADVDALIPHSEDEFSEMYPEN